MNRKIYWLVLLIGLLVITAGCTQQTNPNSKPTATLSQGGQAKATMEALAAGAVDAATQEALQPSPTPITALKVADMEDAEQAKVLLAQAKLYVRVKEYAKALDLFEQVVELDPENPDIYLSWSHAFVQADEDSAGIEALSIAIDSGFTPPGYYLLRALMYSNNWQSEEAIQDFSSYLEIVPHDLEAYVFLTDEMIQIGQYEEALIVCDEGIEMTGQKATLALQKAKIHKWMREYQTALKDLWVVKQNQLEFVSRNLYMEEAFIYLRMDDLNAVRRIMNTAEDYRPDAKYLPGLEGILAYYDGEYRDAINGIDDAFDYEYYEYEFFYYRGMANIELGDISEAQIDLGIARKLCGDPELQKELDILIDNLSG